MKQTKDKKPFNPVDNFKGKRGMNNFKDRPENIRKGMSTGHRRIFSVVIEEFKNMGVERVSAAQVMQMYEHLFNCNESDLKRIVADVSVSMPIRIAAKEMLGKNGFDIVERMYDRAHGKALQKANITGSLDGETTIEIQGLINIGDDN